MRAERFTAGAAAAAAAADAALAGVAAAGALAGAAPPLRVPAFPLAAALAAAATSGCSDSSDTAERVPCWATGAPLAPTAAAPLLVPAMAGATGGATTPSFPFLFLLAGCLASAAAEAERADRLPSSSAAPLIGAEGGGGRRGGRDADGCSIDRSVSNGRRRRRDSMRADAGTDGRRRLEADGRRLGADDTNKRARRVVRI